MGKLDIGDFLIFMRRLRDFDAMAKLRKESSAIEDTDFTPSDVSGFRDIFVAQSHGNEEICFEDVKNIMRAICPMGGKQSEDLLLIFSRLVKRYSKGYADVSLTALTGERI